MRNRVLNATDPTGHRDLALDQGGGGGVDIRLPLLSKGEAEKALKSIGQTAVTTASFIPGVGDAIDVYDFMAALYRGEFGEAGFVLAAAALPGSVRAARNVGGEIVERIARNLDELPITFGQSSISGRFTSVERGSTFRYAGWRVEDVAAGLRAGTISPDELPIQYIVRDGTNYAINNRSLTALQLADMQPTVTINITGHNYYEQALTERLAEATELGVDLTQTPRIRTAR